VLQSLDYGKPMFTMPDFLGGHIHGIEPNSLEILADLPDYYPSETPPNSIMVQQHVKWDLKKWLHYATADEEDSFRNKKAGKTKYDYLFEDYE
jgi:hypothetical protein